MEKIFERVRSEFLEVGDVIRLNEKEFRIDRIIPEPLGLVYTKNLEKLMIVVSRKIKFWGFTFTETRTLDNYIFSKVDRYVGEE